MKKRKEEIASKRGYKVTEDGRLLNPKNKEIGYYCSNGYLSTSIRIDKKSIEIKAHRLQAYQKYGDLLYVEGVKTRHFNGDSKDNSWNNILLGDHSKNMMDIPEQIRIKKARHAASFICKHNHTEIIKFYKNCSSYKKTMEKFNISSKGTLYYILNK